MARHYQNEMVASTNAFCEVLSELMADEGLMIVGTYDHLPVMQFMLKERYEVVSLQAAALSSLIAAGVPEETAIEMVGLKKGTKLNSNEKNYTNRIRANYISRLILSNIFG